MLQMDQFKNGNPASINPNLPIEGQTDLLPYDNRWEFPRERLKLGNNLIVERGTICIGCDKN